MGSLFSALTTAVSGLNAQSSAIGNISDNLSNAQTTGYKAVSTGFEQLVNASNSSVNNPGGVRAHPAYQNDVQGSITSSDTATSLAISGQGYFAVQTASTDSTGATSFTGSTYYTRQGDFTLDKNGYLVNGSGFYLTGYSIDSTTGTVNTSSTSPIQVSALLNNPVATKTVTYNANLPSDQTSGFVSATSTVLVYDSLGNTHDVNYTWTKGSTANQWDLQVTIPDASYTATMPFSFNDGTSGAAGTIDSITAGTGYTVSSGTEASVSLSATFAGTTAQSISLDFGEFDAAGGVTQFSSGASSGTAAAVSVTNLSQDGLPQGSFNNLSISKDGFVSINYSNGTNRAIAQIPIVQFFAQDQLQRASGGAYTATLASGTARYSAAGTTGAGTISSNSLEQSNVDIANQFTALIQAQQVYSANAKIVTTGNQLLQVTINMVQ